MPRPRANESLSVLLLILSAGIAACSTSPQPEPSVELDAVRAHVTPATAAATITADNVLAHISYLASDELAGRDTPSPGLELAATYLAETFENLGLEPAGDPGSFIQRWEYEAKSLRAEESVLTYSGSDVSVELSYASDFFLIAGEQESVRGALTFGGPIGGLRDLEPSALEGRIVAVTTPPAVGMELFEGIRDAARAGAAGLLIILHPAVPREVVGVVAGQLTGVGLPLQAVPAAGVPYGVASEMLAAGGVDLDALTGAAADLASVPTEADGVTVSVEAPLDRAFSTPPNVVGLLRGHDPDLADTYVVLSAHFDHVGIGEPDASGDSIYNGADDDASGTAVLLEVARAFQAMPNRPARSVLFLAVSGEEKGLLGSEHYAGHPTVPLEGVVANINLDMVGRNAPDSLIAVGQEFTSLGPLSHVVASDHPDLGLVVAPDPDPAEQAFFRSDHLGFVKRDIPSIFFTTWDHEDYHRPSDEASRIDADKAARVARFIFLLTWQVGEDPVPPSWNEGALDEVRRLVAEPPF